jgi:RNA polymerase sigma-70 factor (ECF subfamily)
MTASPALPALWEELHGRLLNFISARIQDPQEAEDILQEVFLRIHTGLESIQNAAKVEGWIFRITRNVIIDRYRMGRPLAELTDGLEEPPPDEPDPGSELSGSIRNMVNSLPEPYRAAVLRIDLEAMPQAEFARREEISLSGAKSRVQRGRRLIRAMLQECCHFEFDRYGRVIDYWRHCCCCVRRAAGGIPPS